MHVWLLSDGEPLPGQGEGRRMRSWMLADALIARGHTVEWWASTFSHHRKRLLHERDTDLDVSPGLRLKLLDCGGYSSHASLKRYLHHRRLGTRFRDVAAGLPAPDLLVSAYPKIDMAFEGLGYARRHGVPAIIDVRDLWPTTYLDKVPVRLRPAARVVFAGDFRRARAVFLGADSLVSMSSGVLRWAQQFGGRTAHRADRVFYIGYHAELSRGAIPPPPYLEAAAGKTVFGYVGAFGGSYELETICEVARRLDASGRRDVQFVLAGDGPRRDQVAKQVERLRHVIVPGWLDHGDVKQLLAHTDVALIPWNSVRDAMPNKVFEYLAAGLPIVSSLAGEMEDLIAAWHVGHSYRAGDADALERIVLQLAASEPTRRAMAAQAGLLFRSRFQSDEIYGAYARHIEQVHARSVTDERPQVAGGIS